MNAKLKFREAVTAGYGLIRDGARFSFWAFGANLLWLLVLRIKVLLVPVVEYRGLVSLHLKILDISKLLYIFLVIFQCKGQGQSHKPKQLQFNYEYKKQIAVIQQPLFVHLVEKKLGCV